MKVLKYIPLLLLTSCTSTKYMDQSKHYANYQSYSSSHNDSPKQSQRNSDEIIYKQSDEDFLNDTRPIKNKRDNRTYHVQNYYENSTPTPDFSQILPNERPRYTADTVQHLPPNLFFRPGEFNPFKNF